MSSTHLLINRGFAVHNSKQAEPLRKCGSVDLNSDVMGFEKIRPKEQFNKTAQSVCFPSVLYYLNSSYISFQVEAYHHSEFVVESAMEIDMHPLQINARRINVPHVGPAWKLIRIPYK
jgi:hypothetical protein